MSVPYKGKEFTFTQPDGTALRVRGWGNQQSAVFETLNGYTVTENPATSEYEYANVSPDLEELLPTGARPRHANPDTLGLARGLRIKPEAAKAKAREQTDLPRGTSRWEIRRKLFKDARRSSMLARDIALAPPQRQTLGNFVGLCLLIQFPDVPGTVSQDEVDKYCNMTLLSKTKSALSHPAV